MLYSCIFFFFFLYYFLFFSFFFNDTATTEIYTLSLHDALPIFKIAEALAAGGAESIEVQFPFSDPSADGPYILKACDAALKAGFTVDKGFSLLESIIGKTKLEIGRAHV